MFPLRYQRAYIICVLVLVFGSLSFTVPFSDVQRKLISDDEYDYEFYVSLKPLRKAQSGKNYFWFKGGAVHKSTSGIGGPLLHGTYKKYFKDKALAEQGRFAMGLKEGVWREWFSNGTLKRESHWANGNRTGRFVVLDKDGKARISGHYQRNKKHGIWIDHELQDTVVYKQGEVFVQPADSTQNSFFNRLFKKQKDSINQQKEGEKEPFFKRIFGKKEKKSVPEDYSGAPSPEVKEDPEKKESFFKRLFKKKDKKEPESPRS